MLNGTDGPGACVCRAGLLLHTPRIFAVALSCPFVDENRAESRTPSPQVSLGRSQETDSNPQAEAAGQGLPRAATDTGSGRQRRGHQRVAWAALWAEAQPPAANLLGGEEAVSLPLAAGSPVRRQGPGPRPSA